MQQIIVVKCGGSILNDLSQLGHLLADIQTLKKLNYQILLLHGGGPDINQLCKKFQVENIFKDGLRVTTKEILNLTQMALLGKTNAGLVHSLNQFGIMALGLSGHDLNLLIADFIQQDELGYVGAIKQVNCEFLQQIFALGIVPVIAPLAVDGGQNVLNVNADLAASAIAIALKSQQLVLLSDINGYYANFPDESSLVSELTYQQIKELLVTSDKVASGMIPKLKACMQAVSNSVAMAHIINGNQVHGLTQAVTHPGTIGTLVLAKGRPL